jgi:hypothetical protein
VADETYSDEAYEQGQVFQSSDDDASGMMDDDDELVMLEDAESNTRPN